MTWRGVLAGLLLALTALYASVPYLAAWGVPHLLTRWGIGASSFEFGYPGWHGIDVEHFALHGAAFDVVGDGAHIAYRPAALLRGEADALTLRHLTVLLGGGVVGGETAGRPTELPALWSLLPVRRVAIDDLDVGSVDPPARANGSVSFDPALLQVHLDVTSPLLAVPLAIVGTLDPSARLTLSAAQRGATEPAVLLSGAVDAAQQTFTIEGSVDLSGEALTLLAAYAGVEHAAGDAHLKLRGHLPWPLPAATAWQDFDGSADAALRLRGRLADDTEASLQLDSALTMRAGAVDAQLAEGSAVQLQVPQLAGSALAGADAPELALRAESPVHVAAAHGGIRVGDGLVLSMARLIAPLALRPRGAWNADGTFELTVTSLEGSPRLLAAGRYIASPGAAGEVAARGQLVLAGRVLALLGRALSIPETSGQAVIDFDGKLPIASSGLQLANAVGKGRVDVDVAARDGAGSHLAAALQADLQLADATLAATVTSGARLQLSDAEAEATTFAPMPVELHLGDGALTLGKTDVKLSLPALEIGTRAIALTNVWLTLTKMTRHGDALQAAAVVRANTGRDALPVQLALQHDLATGRGRYTVTADWQINKPLLATQLALRAPYDLDNGKLRLDLHGDWNTGAQPAALRGAGRAHFEGGAHSGDARASGIVAELPLMISGGQFAIDDGSVDIAAVDVGLPLSRVSLRLGVAAAVARIDALHGSVLGGGFAAQTFDYDIARDTAALTVTLDGIDLAQVLALEGEDVTGSGTLDGTLPIRIVGDAVEIANGRVVARLPGGTISYRSGARKAVAKTGLEFVFHALEDFRYDVLDADVALAADGELRLGVKLHGRNPAVENGRAIQFNLNLTESMPALFESLRAAQGITERIEGKISR